jgi:hypothetical protein
MDFCGQCQRRVHNLDLMSVAEREAFLGGCSEKVCVSYTVKRTARLPVALGLGFALAAGANAADVIETGPDGPYCNLDVVITGGTEAGEKLQWVDEAEARLPEKADLPEIDASAWLPSPKT